jgi:hypothetical protein
MSALATPSANSVVPGVLGFLVVAGLGIILYFLLRSMNTQLRKVARGPSWHSDTDGHPGGDGGETPGQEGGPAPDGNPALGQDGGLPPGSQRPASGAGSQRSLRP